MTTLFLLGRVIFGGYFIISGYNHLASHKALTGYAKMKGVPMPEFAVGLTGVMLILGGLSVITGYYITMGLVLLLVFLVPTTFMMHNYWKTSDPMQRMGDRVNFMKNCALIGAVLMMFILPWPIF